MGPKRLTVKDGKEGTVNKLAKKLAVLREKRQSQLHPKGRREVDKDGKTKSMIAEDKRKVLQLQRLQRARRLRVYGTSYQFVKRWRKIARKQKVETGESGPLPRDGPRYRRPIEKLLKSVKKAKLEEIPQDINIHRHTVKNVSSWYGASGVRRQVQHLYNALKKRKRPTQPNVGFDYNKRQKRLLLGRRHRELSKGWRYFEPIKCMLPRKLRPNSHLPDAIFFLFVLIMFLSSGIHIGVMGSVKNFMVVLEDTKEYELSTEQNAVIDDDGEPGERHWDKIAPFARIAKTYLLISVGMILLSLLGFIGVYMADQTLHLVYFVGLTSCFVLKVLTAMKHRSIINCKKFVNEGVTLLEYLVKLYYEKIPAIDIHGNPVLWTNPATGAHEQVHLRTYRAANLMDRVQRNWQCCGVNGFNDYLEKNVKIPVTCCSPLWHLNLYCSTADDYHPKSPKFLPNTNNEIGCKFVLERFCSNMTQVIGPITLYLIGLQFVLFIISCYALLMQARQIRQLKRPPHLRISAGTISQSLQTSAGADSAAKTGGGAALQALAIASNISQKEREHAQQSRFEAAKNREVEENFSLSSSSSSTDEDEAAVHTVNFTEMQNLQTYLDKEDLTDTHKRLKDVASEGFAGRFNVVQNKKFYPYIGGIFSTTYQNETNAGLEAINTILERQFAQHTTDYNWRKLLTKPKQKVVAPPEEPEENEEGSDDDD